MATSPRMLDDSYFTNTQPDYDPSMTPNNPAYLKQTESVR
jgi:hypothetical protein